MSDPSPSRHEVATEETTQDPDVGLKNRYVYIDIKIGTLKDETNNSLELCLVAHDGQGVQGINQS